MVRAELSWFRNCFKSHKSFYGPLVWIGALSKYSALGKICLDRKVFISAKITALNPAVWGNVFEYCEQIPYLTQHVFLGLEDLRARLQCV